MRKEDKSAFISINCEYSRKLTFCVMSVESQNHDALQSKVIDWIKFPLIVGVVFVHFKGMNVSGGDVPIDQLPLFENGLSASVYNSLRVLFSYTFGNVSVPLFFLISGFLFFKSLKSADNTFSLETYLYKLKSRSKTLLTPYVLWISISLCVSVIIGVFLKHECSLADFLEKNNYFHVFWDNQKGSGHGVNILGMERLPNIYPFLNPFWYVRDLIVCVLFSPLIYWFVRKLKFLAVVILWLVAEINLWPQIPGFHMGGFFWFPLGAYFSIFGKNLVDVFRKVKIPSYILSVIVIFLRLYFWNETLLPLGSVTGYLILGIAFFNLSADVVEKGLVKIPKLFLESQFFVYALHTILIQTNTKKLLDFILPFDQSVLCLGVKYFMTNLLTVAFCVLAYWLCRSLFPRICSLLTGGR